MQEKSKDEFAEDDPEDNIPLSELIRGKKAHKLTLQDKSKSDESEDDMPLSKRLRLIEFSTDESEDDMPLNKRLTKNKTGKCALASTNLDRTSRVPSAGQNSGVDPQFGQCEVNNCAREVFSSCHRCNILLCWDHFIEEGPILCSQHWNTNNRSTISMQESAAYYFSGEKEHAPEDFEVDGVDMENAQRCAKTKRVNAQKTAKMLRSGGKKYISATTKKAVAGRILKEACNNERCKKLKKMCHKIQKSERRKIFENYHAMSDLTRQREFLARHIKIAATQKKTVKTVSRRKHSMTYFLTANKKQYVVCKKQFLNTLGISERAARTALNKVHETGVLENEKRGGRQRSQSCLEKEKRIRTTIERHIDRFPRMESHYCRSKSTRLYLHPDLSLRKMYDMFVCDPIYGTLDKIPSFSTYRRVFKTKNLAFHHPKKDQCSLCMTYYQGDESKKEQLRTKFESHVAEKKEVRKIKQKCKEQSVKDSTTLCGVFDMQQVIYLPISRESAIMYKNRLCNFNFTFYDLANKDCFCFVWHEAVSGRGSSEIASCVFAVIAYYYIKRPLEKISLFSDGCYAQNKNSMMAAMLLYAISRFCNIEEISLRFFEAYHGQNEGDSAHSAISSAMSTVGDIFTPSQLYPIFRLARRRQPYKVIPLKYNDFIDFKTLSQDLRILSVRTTEKGKKVNWNNMMEVMVKKDKPQQLFIKCSHLEEEYDTIVLKRVQNKLRMHLSDLNPQPKKISKKKYDDLASFCKEPIPVVRLPEHRDFFESLPHED